MIGVIAPYSEFKDEVERIAYKLQIPIVAEVGALRAGLSKAKKLIEEHNVKVIVARASTADFLKEKLHIPTIKIDITNFDIIKTLKDARHIEESVVLVNHLTDKERIDISTIKELLGIHIDVKYFSDEKDIVDHLNEIAHKDNAVPVIGTAECVIATAGKRGIQSFVVFSQEESITEALLRAKESLEHLIREEMKQKHLETIISHAFDGVISTNNEGYISVCNDVASSYIGLFPNELMKSHYQNIQIPLVKKLFGDGQDVVKHIITNGNQKFILNRNHLGELSFVITFQEVERLIGTDSEIRSKLHHRGFFAKYSFDDLIHQSLEMKQTLSLAKAYAKSDGNILIYGESGTGKELMAQSIHNESKRAKGPFVAINCAALPENLLERELFGYEDGAFTGAKKGGKPGLFEMAHKGTIFLDEIGEIPMTLQARLLRVLQEKEVMRIGGEKMIPVDVRIISATNKNLKESMEEQKFRSDLYYRLNILYIEIPPLRHRVEDLNLLIDLLLKKHGGKSDFITPDIRKTLKDYHWPGNIRELENLIERVVAMKEHLEDELPVHLIEQTFQTSFSLDSAMDDFVKVKIGRLEEMEADIFEHLVEKYDGNKTLAAEKLGISRTTLWKKMRDVNLG